MKCLPALFLAQFFACHFLASTEFSGAIAQTVYGLMPGEGAAFNGPTSIRVKMSKKADLHCAERPELSVKYKCRAPEKDRHNIITFQNATAEMLFGALLAKEQNADLALNVLSEGALCCQRIVGDTVSYQCSIQL